MRRKRKKARSGSAIEAEVPISAMIDVVFLLLIYFIYTQKPVIEETLLGVNLPAPGAKSKNEEVELFTVDVMRLQGTDTDNIYHVDGIPYTVEDLRTTLKETAAANPKITVIINCGPNAKHKKLIRLLDLCGEARLRNLNIVDDNSIRHVPLK